MKKLALITVIFAFVANTFAAEAGIAGGGRINKTNNSYEITYFITDHLGSTRVVVSQSGTVLGTSDYYPFGKRWEGANLQAPNTRYLFSGKEKQTTSDINYMDFGSRMYDDFLGRWFTHDPQSYRRPWETPYGYCGGNPVSRIDPQGELWWLAGLISGAISWVSNGLTTGHWGIKSFLIGAASGLVGAGIGMAATSLATSWGISSGLAGVIGSTAGGIASGAFGALATGGNIGQGILYGGIGGLAGGATGLATKDMKFFERLGLSALSGGVVSGVFAEAQGGNFWNGFTAGAGGAAAGFLGNELCDYIRKKGIERKYMENELGLTKEEIKRLKNYGLKAIITNEYADDIGHSLWNKLKSHQIIDDNQFPFSLRKIDFDKDAIIKAGKLHIRNSTEIMIEKNAYRLNLDNSGLISGQYFNIHYDHFDVIIFPVLHILFDSLYQSWFNGVK